MGAKNSFSNLFHLLKKNYSQSRWIIW